MYLLDDQVKVAGAKNIRVKFSVFYFFFLQRDVRASE